MLNGELRVAETEPFGIWCVFDEGGGADGETTTAAVVGASV